MTPFDPRDPSRQGKAFKPIATHNPSLGAIHTYVYTQKDTTTHDPRPPPQGQSTYGTVGSPHHTPTQHGMSARGRLAPPKASQTSCFTTLSAETLPFNTHIVDVYLGRIASRSGNLNNTHKQRDTREWMNRWDNQKNQPRHDAPASLACSLVSCICRSETTPPTRLTYVT